jgi:uncharacterized protein
MSTNHYPYRINVGFLINAVVGTYRDLTIDESEIQLADDLPGRNIHCAIRVSKTQQGVLAEGELTAETDLECTRCLETYTQKLDARFEELYCFHNKRENEDAEQFLPSSGYLDLQDVVREYLLMEVPYAPVCKPDCKGLCPICGNNLNNGPCSHPQED